ncbi:MAG: hypothetical protein FWB76_05750 [Oscillospiraceae bacterium]|nr:hypothetical protein [Oscillospiraceae bacterium]
MKNHDDFMQAVYAKADVKRKQIKRRNTMIRNASVSFVCTFVIALAIVPISRMFINRPTEPVVPATFAGGDLDWGYRMGGIEPILQDGDLFVPQAQPARMMVVENNQLALHCMEENPEVVDVLAANYMPQNGEVTIDSVEALLEFLAGLPANVHLLQQLIADYDDEFFRENVLTVMTIAADELTNQLVQTAGGPESYYFTDYNDEPAAVTTTTRATRLDSPALLLLLLPTSISIAE